MIYYIIMIVFSPFTAIIPAVFAVNLLIKGKIKVEMNYWNIGLFCLFIYSMVSGIVNKSILSFIASFGFLLYFALCIFAQNYFVKVSRINTVLKTTVYLSTIAAIGGIIEKIAFTLVGMPEHRIFSSFGNPNMTGAWFGNIILIIFYLKGTKKDKSEGVTYNIIIVLIVIALMLTESSGAFIALVGGIFIYYLMKEKKDFKGLIAISITVSILAILFMTVQNKVAKTTPIGEIVTSFNSRVGIWKGAIQMFLVQPILGWGLLGTFEHGSNFIFKDDPTLQNKIISFLIHPHNLWLAFLVGVGVVGLGIYLYVKLNLYRDMIKLYKQHNKLLPLIASINAMVIIQGIVDCTLYAPQLGIIFVCTGAITYNMANDKMIRKARFIKSKKSNKDIVA